MIYQDIKNEKPEISKLNIVYGQTFAIKSLNSEDFKLTTMPVKTRSSRIISSGSPLEWMAPAATRFDRILSD